MRTDGDHTLTQVEAQMTFLRGIRGTGQHAQLIGGKVSLLDADDHARALELMLRHGRKPMSMTHGDFDESYLRRLALDAEGRPRFGVLRMAGHFSSLMLGSRGVPRPRSERDLDAPRRAFVEIFERLRAEHGVRFDLSHNICPSQRTRRRSHGSSRRCFSSPSASASRSPCASWADDCHDGAYARMSASSDSCEV